MKAVAPAKRKEPITPLNPSRRAMARVGAGTLPIPKVCPYCSNKVELVGNSVIYGRSYGEWPWAYMCSLKSCRAYVGLHPFTNIPLGTLADEQLRNARKLTKEVFNPLWQSGKMTRTEAYSWLASQLQIPVERCHIGWFDIEMCRKVYRLCRKFAEAPAADQHQTVL